MLPHAAFAKQFIHALYFKCKNRYFNMYTYFLSILYFLDVSLGGDNHINSKKKNNKNIGN